MTDTNLEDYYTWRDSILYLFGYERELEITPCIKQVGKRHLLQKQIKNNDNFKLKKVSVDKNSKSVRFTTEYPIGKIIPSPKRSEMWSEITKSKKNKKKTLNLFEALQ